VSTPATRPDTTRLQRLAHSYRDSAALVAAVELGLFTRWRSAGPTSSARARATWPPTSSWPACSRAWPGAGPG